MDKGDFAKVQNYPGGVHENLILVGKHALAFAAMRDIARECNYFARECQ